MKKIVSIILALTMVMALAVPAFAAESHNAYIGLAASGWSPSSFSTDPSDCVVTGDGQYVLETSAFAGTNGLIVFVIDIVGLHADCPDATVVVDSIEADGETVEFDASKVAVGDLEENGNLRVEFYNEYGPTIADPALDKDAFSITDTVKITFTVSGIDAEAATDSEPAEIVPVDDNTTTETTESNNDTASEPANTGIVLAVLPMAIAAAAVVVSKKR